MRHIVGYYLTYSITYLRKTSAPDVTRAVKSKIMAHFSFLVLCMVDKEGHTSAETRAIFLKPNLESSHLKYQNIFSSQDTAQIFLSLWHNLA